MPLIMLLDIYLVTTIISWITPIIVGKIGVDRLRRKGYKFVDDEESISENIVSWLPQIIESLILVYNILMTIELLSIDIDEAHQRLEANLLGKGKIYMPTEESSVENENSPKVETRIYTENIEPASTKKSYAEMTVEEKLAYLERERQTLMNQAKTIREKQSKENESTKTKQEQINPVFTKKVIWKRK